MERLRNWNNQYTPVTSPLIGIVSEQSTLGHWAASPFHL
jgi:hypothetical protein